MNGDEATEGPTPLLSVVLPPFTRGQVWAWRDVLLERARQDAKWGTGDHRDGTGHFLWMDLLEAARILNDEATGGSAGPTWLAILFEEVMEAAVETDLVRLREELVQVAAVVFHWIEQIDRRQ